MTNYFIEGCNKNLYFPKNTVEEISFRMRACKWGEKFSVEGRGDSLSNGVVICKFMVLLPKLWPT